MIRLEYQAMPSMRDVAHDGWLYTFTIKHQLQIPSAHSWAAPVRATSTGRKSQAALPVHPSITHKICRVTLLQPARRPPCWASPLAFSLIGFASHSTQVADKLTHKYRQRIQHSTFGGWAFGSGYSLFLGAAVLCALQMKSR
jgi:hypothetical protein